MRQVVGVGLGLLALVAIACGDPRVALKSPSPTAPVARRIREARALLPVDKTLIVHTYRGGQVGPAATRNLILPDGRKIHVAADLLPLVDSDSPTARSARIAAHNARTARILELSAYGSGAAGVLALYSEDYGGAGFVLGGLTFLGLYFIAAYYNGIAYEHRMDAFRTYPIDMIERLNLCVDGIEIIACPPD